MKGLIMRKYLIYGIALLAIFCIGYKMLNRSAGGTVYKTQKIENGDIMESITASGTINPLSTVSVGSQASLSLIHI